MIRLCRSADTEDGEYTTVNIVKMPASSLNVGGKLS